jgi:amino acid adenylation domain-containing protein
MQVLTGEERQRVLYGWNDTTTAGSDTRCVHELVESRVRTAPDAVAVVHGETELSYRELNERADAVAAQLAAIGVARGDFVALHVRRCPLAVVAMLAILKAGAAYVPVESSLPAQRRNALLASSGARVVIATAGEADALIEHDGLPGNVRTVVRFGADHEGPDDDLVTRANSRGVAVAPGARPVVGITPPGGRARPCDAAYMIYTSGSTGQPKGVLVQHAPVVNLIHWVNDTFGVSGRDRILFVTPLGFDLSVYDVFGILSAGGSIRIADEDEIRDPEALLRILYDEPVTFWDSAPAVLAQLQPLLPQQPPRAPTALRLVFLSGDWIPVALPPALRRTFPEATVVGLGGATEATVWSNFHIVDQVQHDWPSIPYGRPIRNSRYYILDHFLEPVPVGASGDLYIGGSCLSAGYYGDPALTASKYVPDPFGAEPGGRLYHTGDRARYWPDGTIEFLGRLDDQVKIRGYRIELGEVESALSRCDGVTAAIAMVRDNAGVKELVAAVVTDAGREFDAERLRCSLSESLPGYLLPNRIVPTGTIPLTANGKVDRKAVLALVSEAARCGHEEETEALSSTEALVAGVWSEVLDRRVVSRDADFFALGGHSLLVPRATAKVGLALGVRVPVRVLVERSRLADFAKDVDAIVNGGAR